jgi:hypothetical protein
MALNLLVINTQSEDSPLHSKAIQKILRQRELQDQLIRQASSHTRILEEFRRFQPLTTLYQATLPHSIVAETIQAQTIQTQAIRSIGPLEREIDKLTQVATYKQSRL